MSRYDEELQQARRLRHGRHNLLNVRVHRLSISKFRFTPFYRQPGHQRAPLQVVRVKVTKRVNSATIPR